MSYEKRERKQDRGDKGGCSEREGKLGKEPIHSRASLSKSYLRAAGQSSAQQRVRGEECLRRQEVAKNPHCLLRAVEKVHAALRKDKL